MKKRNTLSTKAILIIGIILIAAIIITTLVIGIFALNQHSFTGTIKILYTSEDIDGTASVSYQLLSEDGLSDGEVVTEGDFKKVTKISHGLWQVENTSGYCNILGYNQEFIFSSDPNIQIKRQQPY
jgi:hypothetical protein